MPPQPSTDTELAALGLHMASRRAALLDAWRARVTADPLLTTGASLPRAQLHDHIPALLVDFERWLAAGAKPSLPAAREGQLADAEAHGLHRWQQGFDLAEVTRELGRLNECVVDEIDTYAVRAPAPSATSMAVARRHWAQHFGAAIGASTSQFFRLQELEANSQIQDLEFAMATLREMEQQQAQLWQQAAHDLRGNLGVVANASVGLALPSASEVTRAEFVRLLQRNVDSLRHLLDDVTGLARLQAGQEQRRVASFDAAALLRDLCEALQPQAQDRRLFLRYEGPDALTVVGDAVKTRRIAQNLMLNSVKYTRRGGVFVTCGQGSAKDAARWFFTVKDTGPGFDAGPGSELAGALEVATEQSRQVSADSRTGTVSHAEAASNGPAPVRSDERAAPQQQPGEGIGLSIVKRLCDLLNASVEMESTAGVGTAVRILLPLSYD